MKRRDFLRNAAMIAAGITVLSGEKRPVLRKNRMPAVVRFTTMFTATAEANPCSSVSP